MKKVLNKNIFMTLVVALGCASTGIFCILNNKSSNIEVSGYSESSLPSYLDLNDTSNDDIREYYSALEDLSSSERQGTNLLKNLKPILKNNQKYYSYDKSSNNFIWKIYEISDRDWVKSPASEMTQGTYNPSSNTVTGYSYGSFNNPGDNAYIHALYVDRSISNPKTAWTAHSPRSNEACIEREHIWPKSHGFNGEEVVGARGDPMHLWAADGGANGQHSNDFYGYVDRSKISDDSRDDYPWTGENLSGNPKTISNSKERIFEPQDCDKGDIARACFYMVARYNNLAGNDTSIDSANPNLCLENGVSQNSTTGTSTSSTAYSLGILQDLLEWNRLDPPDSYEKHRNNLLYTNFTNNRNPFIDFPEWAEYIWGKSVNGSYNSASTGFANPSSDTIGDFGNGSVNPNPTVNSVTVSPNTLKLDLNKTTTANLTVTVNVTNGASQNVTWESSNSSIATVSSSGVVTGLAVGTCTITATSEFDSTKYGECAVTVIDSSQGLSTGHKYKLGWGAASGEEGTYTNFADVSGSVNDLFSFTTSKNDSGSAPAYNANSSELRLYYSTAGTGGSITIVPEDGITITDAVIKTSTDPLMGYSVDGGSVVTISKENSQYTIEDISASSSLTLQNVNTTNTQLRISTIELTYSQAGGLQQKNLSSISLDSTNAKTNYYVDDDFTYNGLIVTAHYDDNSESAVSPTSVSTPNMSTTGNKAVTVTYTEGDITKTATYQITVSEPTVTSITATVNQTFHPGDMIITSDIYVEDNLGNEVVDFEFADEEYEFTYDDAPSGGGVGVKTFVDTVSYGNLKCDVSVNVSRKAYQEVSSISDVINNTLAGVSGNSYVSWTKTVANSGITYSGNSGCTYDSIQLRTTNSNSGVVITANPNSLNVSSISLNWNSNTADTRTVEVYGKNTSYSSPSDLYGSSKGTLLGTIAKNDSTPLTISGSYLYIGLKSSGSALYLDDITINYGNKQSAKNIANYIMYADTDGQCENKFDFAKEYFEEMYIADKTEFMSSNDYVIATARNRFLAWARHHHIQVTYLNGDYVFSNLNSFYNYSGENLNVDNNNAVVILLVICTVGGGALSALYLLKKKKKSI